MRTSIKLNKFHIFILVIAGVVLSVGSSPTEAKPYVLACEPEWRALVQVIGGDRVKVDSATTAQQDPHYIRAKPSLIAKARRADYWFAQVRAWRVGGCHSCLSVQVSRFNRVKWVI